MRSACNKTRRLLLTAKMNELSREDQYLIESHLKECDKCTALYDSYSESEKIEEKIRTSFHSFVDEDIFTRSVMMEIERRSAFSKENIFTEITGKLSAPRFRLALGAILFIIAFSFFSMEYGDTKKIISLEERMNYSKVNSAGYPNPFVQESDLLKYILDLYNFAGGGTPYLDINKDLALIKKEYLNSLIADNDNLSKSDKEKIDAIKNRLLNSNILSERKGLIKNKRDSLVSEIEPLKKELLESKSQRGAK